jgi:uncharacterized cofD-like protein
MADRSNSERLEIVAIGGGTGLATLLSGLKAYVGPASNDAMVSSLSAIVAVTDDGGSSGRLRDELQMPPPGDIRNCMVALSEDEALLSRLFQHRFSGDGPLSGHNFGNLFLAALSEMTGDFAEAVRLSSGILASKGHIYPASVSDVRISAKLKDGSVVRGETSISSVGPSIERLFLEPENSQPHPDAIASIAKADMITVGPGSLFTSLLPPLLVSGIARAVSESKATKVFICNLMTQPGETDGLSARRHLEIVSEYVRDLHFDFIVLNNRAITAVQSEKYESEGAVQIGVHGSIAGSLINGTHVIHTDILADGDLVRHDPAKLAEIVIGLVGA